MRFLFIVFVALNPTQPTAHLSIFPMDYSHKCHPFITFSVAKSTGNFNQDFQKLTWQISDSIFDKSHPSCVNLLINAQDLTDVQLTLPRQCVKVGEGKISVKVQNWLGHESKFVERPMKIGTKESISLTEVSKTIREIDVFGNDAIYDLMAIPNAGDCGLNGTWRFGWTQVCKTSESPKEYLFLALVAQEFNTISIRIQGLG